MFCLWGTLGFGGEKTLSFLISGGLTRIDPSDLNNFLRDYARDYLYSHLGTAGQNMTPRELRTSYELDFTLLVRVAPRVFLTFGSGFLQASLESEPLIVSYSDLELTLSRSDRIRSIPIRIGLLYSWPLSPRLSLRPHVSLDGYISYFKDKGDEKIKDLEEGYIFGDSGYMWEIKTHAFNWGSTAGLALDIALSGKVSLALDVGYKRARLAGFHGTDNRVASGKFRLFYYEFYSDWTESSYKLLNLPVATYWNSLDVVRDAVLDLSGPYLKAGFRLSL